MPKENSVFLSGLFIVRIAIDRQQFSRKENTNYIQ